MKDRHRASICFAGALLFTLGISHVAMADSDTSFDTISLAFSDKALDRIFTDVDEDGLKDLVWIFRTAQDDERYGLRTCLQAPAPAFSRCSELELPEETRALDIAVIDDETGTELFLLTRTGAAIAHFQKSRFTTPQKISGIQSALNDTDSSFPQIFRFLFDLDQDGKHEAVLATREGIEIHRFSASGELMTQSLKSPSYVEIARRRREMDLSAFLQRDYVPHITTHTTTPAIFAEDLNGDGRLDIATISQNHLRVFEQTNAGKFEPEPSADLTRSVLTSAEKESGFAGEALTFAELNGDAFRDLIILKWGSSEERTQMDRHVYWGRGNWQFPEEADQIIRSEAFFPNFEVNDLNADGLQDMIVPYFHIAPSQAFKAVTQNALRIQLRLFLMTRDKRYAQDPGKLFAKVDRRIALDYHIDVIGLLFGNETRPQRFDPLLSLGYDFNGDEFPDLVMDNGNDQLHFYWGNQEANYEKQPDLSLEHESTLNSEVADLNGDGRADIISFYGKRALGWASFKPIPGDEGRTKLARRQQAEKRAREAHRADTTETRIRILLTQTMDPN